jgi:hypothetical protein
LGAYRPLEDGKMKMSRAKRNEKNDALGAISGALGEKNGACNDYLEVRRDKLTALEAWRAVPLEDRDSISWDDLARYWLVIDKTHGADVLATALLLQQHRGADRYTPHHALMSIKYAIRKLVLAGVSKDRAVEMCNHRIGLESYQAINKRVPNYGVRPLSKDERGQVTELQGRYTQPDVALEVVERLEALRILQDVRRNKRYNYLEMYRACLDSGRVVPNSVSLGVTRIARDYGVKLSARGFVDYLDYYAC